MPLSLAPRRWPLSPRPWRRPFLPMPAPRPRRPGGGCPGLGSEVNVSLWRMPATCPPVVAPASSVRRGTIRVFAIRSQVAQLVDRIPSRHGGYQGITAYQDRKGWPYGPAMQGDDDAGRAQSCGRQAANDPVPQANVSPWSQFFPDTIKIDHVPHAHHHLCGSHA